MKAYKVTENEMCEALRRINEKYEGNIIWNRFERNGTGFNFTLRCKSSKGLGHRLGQSGLMGYGPRKRLPAACWHVHGDFFAALFSVAPKAWIRAGGRRIDATQGNWQDRNIGSLMNPVMYSEACDCGSQPEHKVRFSTLAPSNGSVKETNVRFIKQSDIGKCPFVIFDPTHYREDGTCKCNDPEHREVMKRDWEYTDKDFQQAGLLP